MAFIIDCESGGRALATLAQGFGCLVSQLKEVLLSVDLESIYNDRSHNLPIPPEQYLYDHVVERLGAHQPISSICWFHCTRTSVGNDFPEGIYPLDDAESKVWEIVLKHAPSQDDFLKLDKMRVNGVPDDFYQLRTGGSIHWGPYGILVRDVAFHAPELSQHDYLEIPELIEDILNAYQKSYGVSLFEHYNKALVPKIIKFQSDKYTELIYLYAALGYVYTYVRGLDPDSLCVIGFDGEGSPIRRDQFLSLEVIEP